MNAGHDTVRWLYEESLQVDREWSVETDRGFRWWGAHQAQTVEVIAHEVGPDGQEGALISIRTELLQSLELSDLALMGISSHLMDSASLSGPVFDPERKTLALQSLLRVHDDTAPWMRLILGMAAALQLGEARSKGEAVARATGAELAESAPPGSGLREPVDEMACITENLVIPLGAQPSRWSEEEFQWVLEQFMQRPPAVLATGGGAGFTAEFPFEGWTSLMEGAGDLRHPVYGSGLTLRQSFPATASSSIDGVLLALAMNELELNQSPPGYGLGSWVWQQDALRFRSFFPNLLHRKGLLVNCYFAGGARAVAAPHLISLAAKLAPMLR